jgi:hypothetical protein
MGSLVPGHQVTGALGPGPRAFFYFILFFILVGGVFFRKKMKKTLFSLCFFSLSLSLSLFQGTQILSSFEFNQFHQSKL